MNALAAIEFYRVALLRLVEEMFSSAGIVAGGDPVASLSKPARLLILRVLGPAETTLRRIIQYVAERTAGPLPKAKEKSPKKKRQTRKSGNETKKRRTRAPQFRLFDRMKFFPEYARKKRRIAKGHGPRCYSIDDWKPVPPEPEATPRDPDDALRLCRRLQAIWAALNDIQGQADRLRREMAKRRHAPPGKSRHGPRRPGFPPGHRENHTHEVDEFLYECDLMARQSWTPPRR